jgi:hypothetical protein
MELGENYEDITWGMVEDPDLFTEAAGLWIKDNEAKESTHYAAQKVRDMQCTDSPASFFDLIIMIQDAYSSEDYSWPRKTAAEIARIYCILAKAQRGLAAA